jgi:hypothetical protein
MDIQIRFRPSSHSEDYAIIARYSTEEEAKCGLGELRRFLTKLRARKPLADWNPRFDTDWHPSQAGVTLKKKKLKFQVYTDDFVKHVLEVFKQSKPKKITVLPDHLEIRITLMVPTKTALNFLPLMLKPSESEIVQELNRLCGLPRSVTRKYKQFFHWYFRGQSRKIIDVKCDIEDIIENEAKQAPNPLAFVNPAWRVCYC